MKRFIVSEEKDDEFYWNIVDSKNGKVILQHISLIATREMCDLLNGLNDEIIEQFEQIKRLESENEQLKFQVSMLNKVIEKLKNDIKIILDMSKEEQQEFRYYYQLLEDNNIYKPSKSSYRLIGTKRLF